MTDINTTCEVCNQPDGIFRCPLCARRICCSCTNFCPCCNSYGCWGCIISQEDDPDDIRCEKCDHDIPAYRAETYANPYPENIKGKPLTIGIEIEIDGSHDHHALASHDLVASWCHDDSLSRAGMEYQTQPMATDPETLARLRDLIDGIIPETSQCEAGGHIHVTRTTRQTGGRWVAALKGLDKGKALWLNMRHADSFTSRWCTLRDYYSGKDCAVNCDHDNTIELRTFGPWNTQTVDTLLPAISWIKTMWRFFENHPFHLAEEDIEATSRTAWANAVPAIARKGNR